MDDLFGTADGAKSPASPGAGADAPALLDVFEARLLGQRSTDWRSLFQGYRRLRAITYSSSLSALLAVADLFEEMEVTFGSERVLTRELEALEQATVLGGYRFVDAVADQKAAIEHLLRPALQKGGQRLLRRVREGSMRFAILRQAPSHEKLYLLEGEDRWRVVVGSANLSLSALTGRLRETAGDTNAALRFEKLVPAQVLRSRIADAITLDVVALERECGYAASPRARSWLARVFSR